MEGNVSLHSVLLNGGKEMYIKHFQKFVTKQQKKNVVTKFVTKQQ